MPEDSGVLQSEHHTIYTTGKEMSHAINVNKYLTLKIKKKNFQQNDYCFAKFGHTYIQIYEIKGEIYFQNSP